MGGSLIDDLVEGNSGEVGKLHFNYRAHAFNGCPYSQPCHRILTDRRIDDTPGILVMQPLGCLEGSSKCADILSVNKHVRIVRKGSFLSIPDCFKVGNAHWSVRLSRNLSL